MKVVIERAKWARGGINGQAALLNDHGFMCCLGFVALQAGNCTEGDIDTRTYRPAGGWSDSLYWLEVSNGEIAKINDLGELSEKEREARLTAEFAEHGIELEFV